MQENDKTKEEAEEWEEIEEARQSQHTLILL